VGLIGFIDNGDALVLEPNRTISHYVRQQWSVESQFLGGPVHAITQTADGYLWIGSQKGLVRFDGFNFHLLSSSNPMFQSDRILALTTDDGGRLCVLFWGASVLCYTNGDLDNMVSGASRPAVQVSAIWREENGGILLYDGVAGILRVRKEKVEVLALPTILPGSALVVSMAETHDGKIWLGTPSQSLYYLSNGKVSHPTVGLPDKKINCLLPVGEKELWVGTDKGLFHWDGAAFSRFELPVAVAGAQVLTLLRDHDANIWVGTTRGLLRIKGSDVSLSSENDFESGGVDALFEDREGNLWVGGARGIERIRSMPFVTYAPATSGRSKRNGPIYAGPDGRIWFAPADGGLFFLKDGQIQELESDVLRKEVIYSITGHKGEIWVGTQHNGITRFEYRNGVQHPQTLRKTNGLAEDSVYSVYQSLDGSVWAGTLTGGVSHFKDRRFTTYTTQDGLTSNTVSGILETRDGTVWFATPNGLSSLSNGIWKNYSSRNGLPSENVKCFLEDASSVLWIGTSKGLAFLHSGHLQVPPNMPDSLREETFGIAEDKEGWLWLATSNHVLHVPSDKLSRGTLSSGDLREYGTANGLPTRKAVKSSNSVVADSRGSIWFSTDGGLSVVDPSDLPMSSVPALVHIENILADNNPVTLGGPVRIPPSRKRITLDYTGLSLAAPERIRFRYFLEGFDRGWSEPVEAREAVYTNLSPGSYRFRIVASNSDGLWNGVETVFPFEIEPAVWRTRWFLALCATSTIAGLYLLYLLRLRQVARRYNIRLEERVSERTRIARELHDTLLQSFQALLLHLHVASNLLSKRPEEGKQKLDNVIDQASQAIKEGREAVQGLRASTIETNDLAAALNTLAADLAANRTNQNSPVFDVQVEGASRDLHPILRDDVYRIAGEAMRNAFLHAEASRIEVQIHYDERQLRLRIRDDGKGIDQRMVSEKGRPGHWGLRGMHERAKHVGGNLGVWSKPDSGTEIELTIPGSTAYATPTQRRFKLSRKGEVRSD
jgi:signal transduction histidine kinase/ligand-binding sensor domain-containing protein